MRILAARDRTLIGTADRATCASRPGYANKPGERSKTTGTQEAQERIYKKNLYNNYTASPDPCTAISQPPSAASAVCSKGIILGSRAALIATVMVVESVWWAVDHAPCPTSSGPLLTRPGTVRTREGPTLMPRRFRILSWQPHGHAARPSPASSSASSVHAVFSRNHSWCVAPLYLPVRPACALPTGVRAVFHWSIPSTEGCGKVSDAEGFMTRSPAALSPAAFMTLPSGSSVGHSVQV